MTKLFCILLILFLSTNNSFAKNSKEKLPIPRFVTIKFNEVNARKGPKISCPIEWVFTKKGEPVELVNEYEQWREIKDYQGEGGWVHSSVIAGKRSVIMTYKGEVPIYTNPNITSNIKAKITQKVRCNLLKCKTDWCYINCQGHSGWILRKYLWGIYDHEIF